MSVLTKGHESAACSFCGKPRKDVRCLIAGPLVYICDECVDLCVDIMATEQKVKVEAIERIKKDLTQKAIQAVVLALGGTIEGLSQGQGEDDDDEQCGDGCGAGAVQGAAGAREGGGT